MKLLLELNDPKECPYRCGAHEHYNCEHPLSRVICYGFDDNCPMYRICKNCAKHWKDCPHIVYDRILFAPDGTYNCIMTPDNGTCENHVWSSDSPFSKKVTQ